MTMQYVKREEGAKVFAIIRSARAGFPGIQDGGGKPHLFEWDSLRDGENLWRPVADGWKGDSVCFSDGELVTASQWLEERRKNPPKPSEVGHWACYAKAGKESEVRDAICDLGISARVALKIEAIRRGKQRWPEGVTSAILPNYIFVTCTNEEWHQLKDVKHLAPTFKSIPDALMKGKDGIKAFLDLADEQYNDRKDRIEAGERIAQYEDGDLLMVMAGSLAGELVTFRKMVEAGANGFPEMVVSLGSIGGIELPMRMDPLDVARPK